MNDKPMPDYQTPPTPPSNTDLAVRTDAVTPFVFDPVKYKADLIAGFQELLGEADALPAEVVDQAAYEKSIEVERRLAARKKTVEVEVEDNFCVPARTRWQAATALKNEVVALFTARGTKLADRRTAFRQKQEAIERKKQEEDAAAERERQRLADEARAKAEKEQRDKEETERLERAAIAEKSGDHARAAAILDTPAPLERAEFLAPPPPPPVAPRASAVPVARAAGEVRSKEWTGSVVNRKAFFQALADGAIPFFDEEGKPILEVRQGWLNAKARKHEDKLGNYYPGLVADWKEKSGVRA